MGLLVLFLPDGYAMLMRPNKAETAVHGCHCPGDVAVRMCKVQTVRWNSSVSLAFTVVLKRLVKQRKHLFKNQGNIKRKREAGNILQKWEGWNLRTLF